MKKTLIAMAVGMVVASSASAELMYIDLGTNTFDAGRFLGTADVDTRTGNFLEFSYNFTWATSVYDLSDGLVTGSFYDTNIPTELAFANVPASGTAMDGSTVVNLRLPDYLNGEADLDGLSPLVPPLGTNNEGFLQTWDLQVLYHFDGTLGATGPSFTGGTYSVYLNDFSVAGLYNDLVLVGNLTGSNLQAADLDLFFDVTFAKDNWLWIDRGDGTFLDAADVIANGGVPTLALNTNVQPPIPTPAQLLVVLDDSGNPNAIRQTSLNGGITAAIPEPGSLALLGLGLAGLGLSLRRKRA